MKHFSVGGANNIAAIPSLIWLWLKWGWQLNGAICYETIEYGVKYMIKKFAAVTMKYIGFIMDN